MDKAIIDQIVLAVKNVRFGSVDIIIQDSKVVQLEIKEKVRFDRQAIERNLPVEKERVTLS